MNNTLILFRHGKSNVDPNQKISEWLLNDVGIQQSRSIANNPDFATMFLSRNYSVKRREELSRICF